jgi:site-specific DNA-methyltransferase (adenine-specific)
VAAALNRKFLLIDQNPESLVVMHERLGALPGVDFVDAELETRLGA